VWGLRLNGDALTAPRNHRSIRQIRKIVRHGDAKLTDLLLTLADCPKARSVIIHDRCKARYEGRASFHVDLARRSSASLLR
jgi:hypothetical protein